MKLDKVPEYLTRYYQKGDYPFLSLNELSLVEANEIKKQRCIRNGIGGFYAQDNYLAHRREIEKWIYSQLIAKGGCLKSCSPKSCSPKSCSPVYMVLGESPDSEYDIRADIQKAACELKIPLEMLDLKAVTFTYPDSMYELEYDEFGNITGGRRTNTPKVYTFDEIPGLIEHYKVYDNYVHYIEAQVWDKDLLREIWEKRCITNI